MIGSRKSFIDIERGWKYALDRYPERDRDTDPWRPSVPRLVFQLHRCVPKLGECKEIRLAQIGAVGATKCSFRARWACPPYTDEVCFEEAEGTQVEGHIIEPCS
jgi:hypothetical protein